MKIAAALIVLATAVPLAADAACPGDMNGDVAVDVADVFYLINYLFAGGPSVKSDCAFGCDVTAGMCADVVPANQTGSHLAVSDAFTCTGAQDGGLSAVSAGIGDTLV